MEVLQWWAVDLSHGAETFAQTIASSAHTGDSLCYVIIALPRLRHFVFYEVHLYSHWHLPIKVVLYSTAVILSIMQMSVLKFGRGVW